MIGLLARGLVRGQGGGGDDDGDAVRSREVVFGWNLSWLTCVE